MEIPKLSKADVVLLPLALYGATLGVYKYFIKEPLRRGFEGWVESHEEHLDELEEYIGEMALKPLISRELETPPPLAP